MSGKTWIITKWTKEITDSGKDETVAKKPAEFPHKFRLLDDDGTIYAYGYSLTNDDDEAFEPLDATMCTYGCSEIQYRNNGTWETL